MKNCDFGPENAALGQARGHSFSLYGPPSRQITYIYYIYCVCYRHRFYFGTTLLILTALIFFIFIIWLYLTRIKYQIHEQSKMDIDSGLDFLKLSNNLSR